jgi:type IV fimbrial biogenesis protein FimT
LLDREEGPDVLTFSLPRRCAPVARGFTLIELMVTITLLSILILLSLPSFTAWIRNSQIRTVAEALQGGLRTAQAEALRRNRQLVLSFTNATPALNATAVADGKNWSLQTVQSLDDTGPEFLQGGALADVASAVPITTGVSAVCFNASGRLSNNASGTGVPGASCAAAQTTFDIGTGMPGADRPLRVVLQLGGQVRMCDPNRPPLSATSPDGCP